MVERYFGFFVGYLWVWFWVSASSFLRLVLFCWLWNSMLFFFLFLFFFWFFDFNDNFVLYLLKKMLFVHKLLVVCAGEILFFFGWFSFGFWRDFFGSKLWVWSIVLTLFYFWDCVWSFDCFYFALFFGFRNGVLFFLLLWFWFFVWFGELVNWIS